MKLAIGVLFFLFGQIMGWYQLNLQKMYDWWADKPLLSAILMGVPTSILFWYGWKYISEATGSVWSARFIGSSAGFVIFPIQIQNLPNKAALSHGYAQLPHQTPHSPFREAYESIR